MMMAASLLNEGDEYDDEDYHHSDSSDNDSAMYNRHDQENRNDHN